MEFMPDRKQPLDFITAGATVLRTVLKDRTLKRELPGYNDYAKTVRYRLVPYIW
jgi:protein-S-isoprenylcysteine O-methyltransferase Ste14